MVDNSWTMDIENQIYNLVQYYYEENGFFDKYPNTYITDEEETETFPKYPTIYIHEVSSVETGRDLEGDTTQCVIETIQIDVYINTNKSECRDVAKAVNTIMKKLLFDIVAQPEILKNNGIYHSVGRYRRRIGIRDLI